MIYLLLNKTIMDSKIIKLIKKYESNISTLKENRDRRTEGDTYPYNLDIKLCLEVVEDLESLIKQN